MPSPAESGRPPRRHLGRGPGGAAPKSLRRDGAEAEGRGPDDPETGGTEPPENPDSGPSGTAVAHGRGPGPRGAEARTGTGVEAPDDVHRLGPSRPAGPVVVPAAGGSVPRDPEASDAGEASGSVAHRRGPGPLSPEVPAAPAAREGGAGRPEHAATDGGGERRFTLRLANFEGPFDLLLQLISRHKLDVTEVALSQVTDEFMAYIRAMGPDWDLDQTSEFLVVAATLLDLKAARLLPAAEVEDEADLALLEARDLLFARLLQYRAYKQVAGLFQDWSRQEGKRYPRTVGLEPHHAELLPEVVISIGADGFARLAVQAMRPRAEPQVYVEHIHAPLVSVREQAGLVVALLKARGEATFQELTEGVADTLTVVARFLALLELYREKAVVLDQEQALGALTVRWSGGDGDGMPTVTDEFDQIVEAQE
ncbi:segregation/condensation protein A [Streptomyces sp. NPDC046557]|uniref:segregation and condensation protein A n=1 Tax=Streptomyces sp. NPDC046557 TaxID=3155372 RepID=UPI0033D0B1CC